MRYKTSFCGGELAEFEPTIWKTKGSYFKTKWGVKYSGLPTLLDSRIT
jgi:hypothetical protein